MKLLVLSDDTNSFTFHMKQVCGFYFLYNSVSITMKVTVYYRFNENVTDI